MRHRTMLGMVVSGILAATSVTAFTMSSTAAGPQAAAAGITAPAGSFALTGQQAARFQLPSGMHELHSLRLLDGSTQTRYQQYVGRATVFGGQVTGQRDTAGTATSVVGAYFPGLTANNSVEHSKAGEGSGGPGDRAAGLVDHAAADPETGKLFYEVSSVRTSARPVRWIDARAARR